MRLFVLIAAILFFRFLATTQNAYADSWLAGAASATITPADWMPMAGYASRDRPADGKVTELFAKALVLEAANKTKAVIVTLDLVGIDRELAAEVRQLIVANHGIESERILICCSHTHSGPVVKRNLGPLHFYRLAQSQRTQVEQYANILRDTIVRVVGDAMNQMETSKVTWGIGHANFAVNRRNNKEEAGSNLRSIGMLVGPSDHEVPVLAVRNEKGDLKSVLFGYACHATVLSDFQWSGDYPVYAQLELESLHPGCVALFFAGCGADQNPIPRRTVELARHYGRQLATAVDQVLLTTEMKSASPVLNCQYNEIALPYDRLPTVEELRIQAESKSIYESLRANQLLEGIEAGKPLQPSYPYPVSFWRIGNDLNLVALGGEVVVDYALRIKNQSRQSTFVAGYSHDVMAYIPSQRVLKEGGYEGVGAMVYYGLPSIWSDSVEENIVTEVMRQEFVLDSIHDESSVFESKVLTIVSDAGRGGEGPAWDPEFGVLTSGNGNINRLAIDGTSMVFRLDAGTNGLLFDRDGSLLACEHSKRRVTRTMRDGTVKTLTSSFEGKAYNTPNDITLDSSGRIYFSDPRYGSHDDMQQRNASGETIEGVYRIDLDGSVKRVLGREVERANGVLVSADNRFLYVADNCNDEKDGARKLWRFELLSDGTAVPSSKRLIHDWGQGRGPDGLKQDELGNLYVAAGRSESRPPFEPETKLKGGIYVFNPEGSLIEFVHVPRDEVTNCAFGGADLKTLYITGGGILYSIRTLQKGIVTWPHSGTK